MSLDKFKEQLKDGNFSRIYIIDGDCLYLKRFYLDSMIKAIIPPEALSTDVYNFKGKKMSTDEFLEVTGNFSLQSSNRVVVIRDMPSSSEVISYMMENPDIISDTVTVVFLYEFLKNDSRLKITKEFEKFVSAQGMIVTIDQLSRDVMIKWVIQTLRKENKRITPNDAEYLIDNVGTDMYVLKNEIMKLATINFNENVSREDINSICIFIPDAVIYNLSDDILNKDTASALKRLFDLKALGNNDNYLSGVVFGAVTQLAKIKLLLSQNKSSYDIANILGIKEFIVSKRISKLRGITNRDLQKMLDSCVAADEELKLFSSDSKTVLTKLVVACTT